MRIYIDHHEDEDDFAVYLSSRLRGLDNLEVIYTLDLRDDAEDYDEDIRAMETSDIIIPIVTPEYLFWNSSDNILLNKLDEIRKSSRKTLFPIIYKQADWSSENWIVKSKIFPESGEAYLDLVENDKDKLLNDLIRTISDIAAKNRSVKDKPKQKSDLSNQIFISHSHIDADFAELLKFYLEKEGINCWMDNDRLKVGQDWREEIDSGIKQSKGVIVIMSPEARKSEYVTYEWAFAWGNDIEILPIMLKQTALHPRLESLQYMDFTNRVTRPYDELITRIKEL